MAKPKSNLPSAAEDSSIVMDRGEFAAQFRLAYPRLWLIAVGVIGDRTHADDIVQEAAIIALRKVSDFTPGSNFGAWMSEIVRRCARNYARKTRNRRTVTADPSLLEQTEQSAQSGTGHSPLISDTGTLFEYQTEFDDEVLRALNSLSDEARCCLLLRTVQQLSYAEISELMQIPTGTAMSHVHRSKATMRTHLQHHPQQTTEKSNPES